MLVRQLTREIEAYACWLEAEHPLIERARKGDLPASCVAAHLSNIRFSIQSGYRHMQRAEGRARELGLDGVADFLAHKFDEEYGHDRWATEDVTRLSRDFDADDPSPSPSTAELMGYLDDVLERDPRVYLAYIFFVEYLTVLAGPAFVRAVEDGCGIPATHLSVVARHVELDRAHVAEALGQLEALTRGADRELWVEMLARAMHYFERSCTDAVQLAA